MPPVKPQSRRIRSGLARPESVIRNSHHRWLARGTTAVAVALLIYVGAVAGARRQSAQNAQPARPTAERPAKVATGNQRCAICHSSAVAGYEKTTMAHSLRRATREADGTVTANRSTITISSSPDGFFQRWSNGGDTLDFRVDWVIGSGTHASGYLVNVGDHLFQSPVAYYKSRGGYDLAPGFENQTDPDFTRPIREECVLCHAGAALHVGGTLNEYRAPIFPAGEEAITCERCHGPAEMHITDPRAGTILNPAKLEPAARDSVCEQCHLFGAARVANPGRRLSDFTVGERAEDVFTTYHDANPNGAFKVISHAEQLALSACSRNSGGKLWCGTCHDPHNKPAEPVSYYRAKCLACHATSFPAAPHPAAQTSDCLSCHMPRRDAKDGGHTAFTDHRIQRKPQEMPSAPSDSGIVAWREPAAEFQTRNLGIASIDAGMQRHSGALILQGYRMLTAVQEQFSGDSDFFKWIGQALLIGKQDAEAQVALERAAQLDPNSAVTQGDAASPYLQDGDDAGAIGHLERALKIDPLDLPAASKLAALYKKDGHDAEADELSERVRAAMNGAGKPTAFGAGASSASNAGPLAESVYKNIQVLKGVRADQVVPSMEFTSSSLGVQCSYCHVEGHFEKDDKKPKQTARAMMRMVFGLNEKSFNGTRGVTCYSCHRGSVDPAGTLDLSASGRAASGEGSANVSTILPSARQILDAAVAASGGQDALDRVTTRIARGHETLNGQTLPIEIYTDASGKIAVVRQVAGGATATTVFDGSEGWTTAPGRPARIMHEADAATARLDADLRFPADLLDEFPEATAEYFEEMDGRPVYFVSAKGSAPLELKLYFDRDTHTLVRELRYAESPLGRNPTQIDYADYRNVSGVEVPFRVTVTKPGGTSVIEFDDVQANVPIDPSVFARPASLGAAAATAPKP
jgi:photosynthetic reaction center cytochrome c subunit